jgi:integration host factor subunit beta
MISKKDCARVVDAFLDAVKDALRDQHNIEVRGFGTFKIRRRKTRMARNPRTGEPVEVAARPVPVFKPSKELRALVAEEFDKQVAADAQAAAAAEAAMLPPTAG